MKKRVTAILLVALAATMIAGCGFSAFSAISNQNLTISQYKGLEILKVDQTEVTDDDVQSQIDSILSSNPTKTTVTDRVAQSGDWVNIDYTGMIDGVAFSGGTATAKDLNLGSGTMIPGFESAIIGHGSGEQFEFDLAFPDPYTSDPTKAGVTAHWTITINSIYTESTPELTDEYVQNVIAQDGITTAEQYRDEIRSELTSQAEEQATSTKRQEVWTALIAKTTVKEYPSDKVDEMVSKYTSTYQNYAAQYGVDFETFLEQQVGMTEDEFNTKVQQLSQQAVEQELVMDAIAEREKLAVDDAYYEQNKDSFAQTNGFTDASEMESMYDKDTITTAMQQDRVLTLLVNSAKEVDQVSDSENAAEKIWDKIAPEFFGNQTYMIAYCIVVAILCVIAVISLWLIFLKAEKRGWAAIVPLYNTYTLFNITWGNGWLFLLLFIPIANIVFSIMTEVKLAKSFGKGGGFAVGLIFLPVVFMPILAFGQAEYLGVPGKSGDVGAAEYAETTEDAIETADTDTAADTEPANDTDTAEDTATTEEAAPEDGGSESASDETASDEITGNENVDSNREE